MRRRLLLLAGLALLAPRAQAAPPRAQLQIFFQSTLQDAAYQQQVFGRLAKAWRQPAAGKAPQPGRKAVVQAVVARDGGLDAVVVSLESGSKAWDAAALAAVKKAAPFAPLPASYNQKAVEVHFHFGWGP